MYSTGKLVNCSFADAAHVGDIASESDETEMYQENVDYNVTARERHKCGSWDTNFYF